MKDSSDKYNLDLTVEKTFNDVRVTLEHIGEGLSGDYDQFDENDRPLLRFSIDYREDGEWYGFGDASFCTDLDCSISREQAEKAIDVIFDKVGHKLDDLTHKRTCEELSWLCLEDLN